MPALCNEAARKGRQSVRPSPWRTRMLKALLTNVTRPLRTFGIDPRAWLSLRHVPRYYTQAGTSRARGGTITHRYPVLSDYDDTACAARGHYFHQDLLGTLYLSFPIGSRNEIHFNAHRVFHPRDVFGWLPEPRLE